MASSTYRSRWRIELEGGVTVEVTTNAKDSAAVVLPLSADGKPQFSMGIILEIVHNALMRTETPGVPRSMDEFLEVLVEAEELDPADQNLDPTPPARSAGSP